MKYLIVVLLSLVSLVGCSTPEEKRAYQLQRAEAEARRAAMTPRDKCLEQANSETRICHLGALSLPNVIKGIRLNSNAQIEKWLCKTDVTQGSNESSC